MKKGRKRENNDRKILNLRDLENMKKQRISSIVSRYVNGSLSGLFYIKIFKSKDLRRGG